MSAIKIDEFNKRMRRAERNRRVLWAALILAVGCPSPSDSGGYPLPDEECDKFIRPEQSC